MPNKMIDLDVVPNRQPDIIVIIFDDGDSETVRKTYKEAANAIIRDDNTLSRGFERATAYWFEFGNRSGEEILAANVTRLIEDMAEDMISADEREGRYDRAHNASLRHPT